MSIFCMLSSKKRTHVKNKVENRQVKGKEERKNKREIPWKNHTIYRTYDRAISCARWLHNVCNRDVGESGIC